MTRAMPRFMGIFVRIIRLAILVALSCSASASDEFGVIIRQNNFLNLPRLSHGACSAGVVDIGRDELAIVSANHCVRNRDANESFEILLGARSSKFIFAFQTYEQKFSATMKEVTRFPMVDVFYYLIPRSKIGNAPVLKIAASRPEPEHFISFTGYPDGDGPQKFNCRYRGLTFAYSGVENRFQLSGKALCPFIKDLVGASGSPVTNARGEFIGVITGTDISNKKETFLFFTPILAENLSPNKSPPLLLARTGEVVVDSVLAVSDEPARLKIKYDSEGYISRAEFLHINGHYQIANLKRGVPHGEIAIYTSTGAVVYRKIYDNGILISN